MNPEADGRGEALERYRAYLNLLARTQLNDGLASKVDPSGIVQDTLWEAYQAGNKFQQLTEAQQAVWLRTALAHNLKDEARKLSAQKRPGERERSLEAALEESSARLEALLAADQSSPSERAVRNEQLARVAEALEKLSPDQRQAVELHYFHGRPLAEIAQKMRRGKEAVAKLLERGIRQLRHHLAEHDRE